MDARIRSMTTTEWILLFVLSICWGGSFLFVGMAVKELSPLTIVSMRLLLAALILQLLVHCTRCRMPKDPGVWGAFLVMGLVNNLIPFSLVAWGQSHIASGLASILNATTPFFTIVIAHWLTGDEKITRLKLAGIWVGFTGTVLMIGTEALGSIGNDLLAELTVLAAACCYALATTFGRRFRRLGVHPLATAAGQVTASAAICFPVAALLDPPWQYTGVSFMAYGSVIALAVFSTVLAYILYFRILSTSGATNVMLVTLLIPASAIAFGSIFLGEQLKPEHFVGMFFIGMGLIIIDGRLPRFVLAHIRGQ